MNQKIGLIFPGQGSQAIGMGQDFYENFKCSQLVYEEASDRVKVNLKKLCFEGPLADLTLTENLQPALFTTEMAIMTALQAEIAINPIIAAGHSLGEYSAIASAKALSLSDGVFLTQQRGKAMQSAVAANQGAMCAVIGLANDKVLDLVQPYNEVEPANFNAPGQVVLSGSKTQIDLVLQTLKNNPEYKGAKAIMLNVSAPFHCQLMEPARKVMQPLLAQTQFSQLAFPLLANVTAAKVEFPESLPGLLADQIIKPVRWTEIGQQFYSLGAELLLEIGPGKVLGGLQKRIDPRVKVIHINSVPDLKGIAKL